MTELIVGILLAVIAGLGIHNRNLKRKTQQLDLEAAESKDKERSKQIRAKVEEKSDDEIARDLDDLFDSIGNAQDTEP